MRQWNFYRSQLVANRLHRCHHQLPLWTVSPDEVYQKYESHLIRRHRRRRAHANESCDSILNILNYLRCPLSGHSSHRHRPRTAKLSSMIARNHRASSVKAQWRSRWFWMIRPNGPYGRIASQHTERRSANEEIWKRERKSLAKSDNYFFVEQ